MSLDLTRDDNEHLLRTATERGINYFDTADLYDRGANEELVGSALKPVRDQVIIATKVGNQWLPDGSGWQWNPTKQYILEAVDQSLKRLQTDYIDIYQLHGGTIDDDRQEVMEAFEQLKQQGKIRYYGISSIRPNVIDAYKQTGIVSNMLQYSLLDRRPEEEVLDILQQHEVGVMVRGGLAKGLLGGKPAKDYLEHSTAAVSSLQNGLNEIKNERSLTQTALKYVLSNSAVTTAVVGIRTMEQLIDAVKTSDAPDLSMEELDRLKNILPAQRYQQHRIQ